MIINILYNICYQLRSLFLMKEKALIPLKPVHQTGHNCKTTAIAAVDQYFASQLGFEPIPLHKKMSHVISVRELAKEKGSIQGELLDVCQFTEIFADIGYETELVDFHGDYDSFKKNITDNISEGNLLVACFAVDLATGNPTNQYIHDRPNEHAAVIHGFDKDAETLTMTHWDKQRTTSMRDFYHSSMKLPKERKPEYYRNVKHENPVMKYDLIKPTLFDKILASKTIKKSIIPQKGSGFHARLFVIKKPELKTILNARKKLLNAKRLKNLEKIDALFKALKEKTDKLIRKGEKGNLRHAAYQRVSQTALQLNNELTHAKKLFDNHEVTFDVFKRTCEKAIKKASPEFKQHRSWHSLNPILRWILGILAALTIVPALTVAVAGNQGYLGTCFHTPKTDAAEKLASFAWGLEKIR